MDLLLLMILNSLTQIHPIESRAELIRTILEMAEENKDVLIFNCMYDVASVISIKKELKRYLYCLENPSCYRTKDEKINLAAYKKMFGE